MQRLKVIGLALVAVVAATALTASAASAAEYVYKVGGAELKTGESREITSKIKKTFILKGEVIGIKTRIECKKQTVAKGAVLQGGKPGKSEEQIEFTECKAIEPAGCSKVEVKPAPAINEIVTVTKPAALAGKLATVFTPKTGTVFTKIKFEGCLLNSEPEVTGSAAGLDTPEKVEQAVGTLVFPAEQITEVEKSGGGKTVVGLKFGGNPSTLEGESEVELVSKANWGAF